MKAQFKPEDHKTWNQLYSKQNPLRDQQMIPEFSMGLKLLGIHENEIPSIEQVNEKLRALTGWEGQYVSGFVEAAAFFEMLSNKKFPVGCFIRDPKDLSYTPEPDVFHDLYGHLPFYTIPEYADFCVEFGKRALKFKNSPKVMEEFQRLFWFTIEFALVKTNQGTRIFGAGIASSFSECAYALSNKPKVLLFDAEYIRNQDFRIDIIQDKLFILENVNQLYSCLDNFEKNCQV